MAHKRKDTLRRTSEWAKHLRRDGKREQAKGERRASREAIAYDWQDMAQSRTPFAQ